jgi:hypothetical protein
MTSYAGLDVSQQETHVCVVDAAGAVLWTGKTRSEPPLVRRYHPSRHPPATPTRRRPAASSFPLRRPDSTIRQAK